MSAVAGLAKRMEFEVSGSDSTEVYSPAKDILDREGIAYTVGYSADAIANAKADLYIVSAGETENNSEVAYILENKLPYAPFAELLYELTKEKLRVVVAGTHGKSTTTGLIGHVLKELDDASFMTGAVLQNYESNFYSGDGHYFIIEGDEYKSAFDDPIPKFQYYR